jgi:hypothetical protein
MIPNLCRLPSTCGNLESEHETVKHVRKFARTNSDLSIPGFVIQRRDVSYELWC